MRSVNSVSCSHALPSVSVIVSQLLGLIEAKAAALPFLVVNVCDESAPEVAETAAAAACELAVLLESVASLQKLVAAAECPNCGYKFLR